MYKKEFQNEDKIEIINSSNSFSQSNYWLIVIKFRYKIDLKNKFMLFSKKNSFETRAVWKLLFLQKYLQRFNSSQCHSSKLHIKNCFCIPSGLDLKKKDIKKISNNIKSFLKGIN